MTDVDQILTERVGMRYVWTCIAIGAALFAVSVYVKALVGDTPVLRGLLILSTSLLILLFLYLITNLLQIIKDGDTVTHADTPQ